MSKIRVFDKREKKEKLISLRLFNNHLKFKTIGIGKESVPRYEILEDEVEKKNSQASSKKEPKIKAVKTVDKDKLKALHLQYEKVFNGKKVAPKFSKNAEWIEKKIEEADVEVPIKEIPVEEKEEKEEK